MTIEPLSERELKERTDPHRILRARMEELDQPVWLHRSKMLLVDEVTQRVTGAEMLDGTFEIPKRKLAKQAAVQAARAAHLSAIAAHAARCEQKRKRTLKRQMARHRRRLAREDAFQQEVLLPFLKTYGEARARDPLPISLTRRQRSLLRAGARRGIEVPA